VAIGTNSRIRDAHLCVSSHSFRVERREEALISMTATALINVYLQRDFAREWAESLRVKRYTPLGEEEIARRLRERG
jgi:hypothetical protein